jgi:hypothetical protein
MYYNRDSKINDVANVGVYNEETGRDELHAFMRVDGKLTDVGGAVKDYQPDNKPSLQDKAIDMVWAKRAARM